MLLSSHPSSELVVMAQRLLLDKQQFITSSRKPLLISGLLPKRTADCSSSDAAHQAEVSPSPAGTPRERLCRSSRSLSARSCQLLGTPIPAEGTENSPAEQHSAGNPVHSGGIRRGLRQPAAVGADEEVTIAGHPLSHSATPPAAPARPRLRVTAGGRDLRGGRCGRGEGGPRSAAGKEAPRVPPPADGVRLAGLRLRGAGGGGRAGGLRQSG